MQIHFWSSFVCSHLEESITFLELFHTLRVYNNTLVSMVFIWALLNTSISSLYIHPFFFFFFFFFFQIKFTCKRIKLSYYSTSKNSPIPNPNPISLLISFVFFPSPFTSILKSLLLTLKKKGKRGNKWPPAAWPCHLELVFPFLFFSMSKKKKKWEEDEGKEKEMKEETKGKGGERERENKEENC